jgi:hypothetical protein
VRARLKLFYDPVAGRKYLDMRIALIARLFSRGSRIRPSIGNIAKTWMPELTPFETTLIKRLLR